MICGRDVVIPLYCEEKEDASYVNHGEITNMHQRFLKPLLEIPKAVLTRV